MKLVKLVRKSETLAKATKKPAESRQVAMTNLTMKAWERKGVGLIQFGCYLVRRLPKSLLEIAERMAKRLGTADNLLKPEAVLKYLVLEANSGYLIRPVKVWRDGDHEIYSTPSAPYKVVTQEMLNEGELSSTVYTATELRTKFSKGTAHRIKRGPAKTPLLVVLLGKPKEFHTALNATTGELVDIEFIRNQYNKAVRADLESSPKGVPALPLIKTP